MSISILNPLRRSTAVTDNASDRLWNDNESRETGFATRIRERLWRRMARECEAMMEHALSTGRVVPAEVVKHLDQAISAPAELAAVAASDRLDDDAPPPDTEGRSSSTIKTSRLTLLAKAHAELALAIAPATPEAVLLMADERGRHPVWYQFGPLPLVRQMLGLTLISLVALLGVGVSPEISAANMSNVDLFGYSFFIVEAYLISAASIGACFANLHRINTVISDGTYDPRVQSTYWTRWVMGVIAGTVLSGLVYDFPLSHSGNDAAIAARGTFVQPILALVGGYSVDFVHGILKRTINTLGNFFGVSDQEVDDQQRGGSAENAAQEKLVMAAELAQMQKMLSEDPDLGRIRQRLDGLIQQISVRG